MRERHKKEFVTIIAFLHSYKLGKPWDFDLVRINLHKTKVNILPACQSFPTPTSQPHISLNQPKFEWAILHPTTDLL